MLGTRGGLAAPESTWACVWGGPERTSPQHCSAGTEDWNVLSTVLRVLVSSNVDLGSPRTGSRRSVRRGKSTGTCVHTLAHVSALAGRLRQGGLPGLFA